MKIIFIRPNISNRKSSDAMQPLVFAILDAYTPAHHEKIFMDDCIEEIDYSVNANLVAITVGTYTAKRAYTIADKFREKGATIVMGGFHATAMPYEALQHAHAVVVGDAEPVWEQLLCDFEQKQLKPIYKTQYNNNTLHTKFNRKVFTGKKYFPAHMVQWGRGCKHNCDFCSIKSFYGDPCMLRPINNVVAEIATLSRKIIFFVDDNLYHDHNLFVEFLHNIKPLKRNWACQVSIDVANDDELIRLMKAAGCVMALLGIETFDPNNLKLMNKSWNIGENKYTEAIQKFRKSGIMVYGTFIFGYDFDTIESFSPTVQFAIKNKLFLANFNPLYPMPGTTLYKRLLNEGRLEYEQWWLHPEFYYGKSMFKPLHMTSLELENGCFKCKKNFNSISSIFSRMLDFKANAAGLKNVVLFLWVNKINRREVYRKQHLKLGEEL